MSLSTSAMSAVVFISNLDQARVVLAQDDVRECVMFTGDPDVLCECMERGIDCHSFWSAVGQERFRHNEEAAWRLCDCFSEALLGKVMADSCDILQVTRYDLFTAYNYVLNAADVVLSVLDRVKPEEVISFSEQAVATYWDAVPIPPDTLNGVVAAEAKRRGIALRKLSLPAPSHPADSDDGSDRVRYAGAAGADDSIHTLIYGQALDADEQAALKDELHGSEGWMSVSVAHATEEPSLHYNLLRDLPFQGAEANVPMETLRSGLLGAMDEAETPHADTLVEVWDLFLGANYKDWLHESVRHYRMANFLQRALSPDVTVTGYGVFGMARSFIHGIRDGGGATLAIHHGGVGYISRYRRYIDFAGAVVTWGERDAEVIGRWRGGQGEVHQVGSLRADLARSSKDAKPSTHDGPRIVLVTSRVGDLASPFVDAMAHVDTCRAVFEMCRKRSDWSFVIRRHPRNDYQRLYDQDLVKEAANIVIDEGGATGDADVIVLMNTPSTVSIEGFAQAIPVIYLNEAVASHERALLEDGAWVVRDASELEKALDDVLSDEERRAQVVSRGDAFLRQALCATGGDASRRMRALIDDLRKHASRPVAAKPVVELRWIIDAATTVQQLMDGRMVWSDFKQRVTELRKRARNLNFQQVESFSGPELGGYFLDLIVWRQWNGPLVARRRQTLWLVYSMLPKPIRPTVRRLRYYWVASKHRGQTVS